MLSLYLYSSQNYKDASEKAHVSTCWTPFWLLQLRPWQKTSGHFLKSSHSALVSSLMFLVRKLLAHMPCSGQVPWKLEDSCWHTPPPSLCFLPQAGLAEHVLLYRKYGMYTVWPQNQKKIAQWLVKRKETVIPLFFEQNAPAQGQLTNVIFLFHTLQSTQIQWCALKDDHRSTLHRRHLFILPFMLSIYKVLNNPVLLHVHPQHTWTHRTL